VAEKIYAGELADLIIALFPTGEENVAKVIKGTFEEIQSVLSSEDDPLRGSPSGTRCISVPVVCPAFPGNGADLDSLAEQTYQLPVIALERIRNGAQDYGKPWVIKEALFNFLLDRLTPWIKTRNDKSGVQPSDNFQIIRCRLVSGTMEPPPNSGDLLANGWAMVALIIEIEITAAR